MNRATRDWDFNLSDDSTYELLYAQDETAAHFKARLIKLDGKIVYRYLSR